MHPFPTLARGLSFPLYLEGRRSAAAPVLGILAVIAAALFNGEAEAQDYPTHAIRVLIPFSAGGPNDVIGRPLAEKMSQTLGQPIVVENRTGAQGQIATLAVARAEADGYTMLMTTGSHVANQVLYAKLPYDAVKDFAPVALLAQSFGIAMVGRPDLPAIDVKDFIARARERPGRFSFAHPGVGNANHIAGELFQKICGVELLAVPYKGSGSYVSDVISGQVDIGFMSTALATPNVNSRLVKPLAVTGPRRAPSMPEVPTMMEVGYPDFDWTGYFGLWFPAGTPPERVELINRAAREALQTPELRKVIVDAGLEVIGSTPDEFGRYIEKDLEHQRAVVQRIGLQLQP